MKRTNILTAVLILTTVFFFIFPASADTIIIHTNDVHGHFSDNIGYAGLVSFIEECSQNKEDDIILLDAGDAFQGTAICNYDKGKSAVSIMNAFGYDAMCPGNHDFDYGSERLLELSKDAEFPILAANIYYEENNTRVFQDSEIIKLEDMTIGIFGLATPETKTLSTPKNTEGLVFAENEDFYKCTRNEVDMLRDQGCDIVICLAHLGLDDFSKPYRSIDLAENVKGIDIIVDGHSHTVLPEGMKVNDTMIVSAGTGLKEIGVVRIASDTDAGTSGKFKITPSIISDYTKKMK